MHGVHDVSTTTAVKFMLHLSVQHVEPAVGHLCNCIVALLQAVSQQESLKHLRAVALLVPSTVVDSLLSVTHQQVMSTNRKSQNFGPNAWQDVILAATCQQLRGRLVSCNLVGNAAGAAKELVKLCKGGSSRHRLVERAGKPLTGRP